jgi:predicted nucleic acid-binding protein
MKNNILRNDWEDNPKIGNILIDTCFWYALYDESDEHYKKAQTMVNYIQSGTTIVLPFPVLYETLDTRFCKRKGWVTSFNEIIHRGKTILISDDKYKENALKQTFFTNEKRPMSFVDMIIRFMLDDVDLNLNALITFNERDFIDVCHYRRIELISE